MSVKVTTWVWHETTAKGSDLLVLLALADTANDDGECWPGVSAIAEKVRMDRATVQRRLASLERGGLLERVERPGSSNLYRILVGGGPQIAAPSDEGGRTVAAPGAARLRQGVPHGCGTEPSLNRQGTVSGARKRASRIDPDFSVSPEMRSWAVEKGYGSLDLEAITEDFVDYWLARSGAEAAKLDWARTWQRWVRKEAQAGRGPVARPQRSSWDRAVEVGSPEWNARHGRGDAR